MFYLGFLAGLLTAAGITALCYSAKRDFDSVAFSYIKQRKPQLFLCSFRKENLN